MVENRGDYPWNIHPEQDDLNKNIWCSDQVFINQIEPDFTSVLSGWIIAINQHEIKLYILMLSR